MQSFKPVLVIASLFLTSAAYSQQNKEGSIGAKAVVKFSGTGCKSDADTKFEWIDSSLILDFSAFKASKGKGVAIPERRKSCSISLEMSVPAGTSYALLGYSSVGLEVIADKDSRTFNVLNYFPGAPQTGSYSFDEIGPGAYSFHLINTTPPEDLIWSPCDGSTVNQVFTSSVAIKSGGDRDSLSYSDIHALSLDFITRECPVLQ